MIMLRNLTYRYENIFSKIFVFWPKITNNFPTTSSLHENNDNSELIPPITLALHTVTELPIISLINYTYLLN